MKNDYEVRGEVTAIFINYKGKQFETIIDTADLEKVQAMPNTWFINDNGYVRANFPAIRKNKKSLRLHRLIMSAPKGLDVDHINRNKLDNRKANLRLVTRGQNNQNQKIIRSHTKSKVRGVAWHSKKTKWRAYVNYQGRQLHLGYFHSKAEAAKVASAARREYMPFSNEVDRFEN